MTVVVGGFVLRLHVHAAKNTFYCAGHIIFLSSTGGGVDLISGHCVCRPKPPGGLLGQEVLLEGALLGVHGGCRRTLLGGHESLQALLRQDALQLVHLLRLPAQPALQLDHFLKIVITITSQ